MKRSIKSLFLLFVLSISFALIPKQSAAQSNRVSFQVFYDELSPYGQWVDYKNYGYAWIPDAGPDFVPYSTDGYWVNTDYGWTWVSDYEWGWAPFHYGRWDYDNYYGWLWVPDNEWGPSWVNWRRADGYYGWSPMEPGISINISFGRPYNRDNDHWMFVRDRDFGRSDISRYYIDRNDYDRIGRNSTVINQTYIDNSRHTTYITGPSRGDVQRVTGRRINPVAVRENNRPGQNMKDGQLSIYRPQVIKNNGGERRAAPSRVVNLKDVKRPSERNASSQPRNSNQQNNNYNRSQPSQQQRNANPTENSGRQQQQRTARPQQGTTQPAQQQQEQQRQQQQQQQQRTARPQQGTTQPAQQQQEQQRQQRQQQQQQQQQQRTARPQQNNTQQPAQQQQEQQRQQQRQQQQQQQRTARPQQNAQPAQQQQQPQRQQRQQQNAQPAQQPAAAEPQNSDKKEQSNPERGRRRNE